MTPLIELRFLKAEISIIMRAWGQKHVGKGTIIFV